MQRSKHLALLFLIGAVLVGGALGFTADRVLVRDRLATRYGCPPGAVRRQMHDDLGLSAAQGAQVDAILDRRNARVDSLIAPVHPQLRAVKDSARADIRALLDDGQRARWDAMMKDMADTTRRSDRKRSRR